MRQLRCEAGFTLLEVIVALAILALASTAMAGIYSTVTRASRMTQDSALLGDTARAKLAELEAEVRDTGALSEESGDFGDVLTGWGWEASLQEAKSDNLVSIQRLEMTIQMPKRGALLASNREDKKAIPYTVYVMPAGQSGTQ